MGNKETREPGTKKGNILGIPVFFEKRGTSRKLWRTLFPGNMQLSTTIEMKSMMEMQMNNNDNLGHRIGTNTNRRCLSYNDIIEEKINCHYDNDTDTTVQQDDDNNISSRDYSDQVSSSELADEQSSSTTRKKIDNTVLYLATES